MSRKKTMDPKLIALYDQAQKAKQLCERLYSRMARTFRALEKARRKVARAERRIARYYAPEASSPEQGD